MFHNIGRNDDRVLWPKTIFIVRAGHAHLRAPTVIVVPNIVDPYTALHTLLYLSLVVTAWTYESTALLAALLAN